ncbi:hypothetical protein F5876DRAFT_63124 [Lentinula aff. lateritia]|uniref:Uncharacterized protein n=1 Tax=Lentinula aff. lateritia TaxID=2804960 RepID=A0ACC1U9W8_9AGAR|nr:hypothetical protein F5876DRAFT_63124 [Lentinula aff. lateritia]
MVEAATTTTTLDDANSSVFTFASAWNRITPSDPCNGCTVKLDSNQVLDGTWHDGSVAGSTASLQFEGSSVTLYGVTHAGSTSALTFVLDGGSPVNLNLSSPTTVYNCEFFSVSGLSSGFHILSWTIEANNAVALIDYAIVTSDVATSSIVNSGQGQSGASSSSTSQVSSSSSSTQKSKPAATTVVDSVLGCVSGVALVAVIAFLLVWRRRKSTPNFIPGLKNLCFDNNSDSQLTLENGARRANFQSTPALLLPVQGQVHDTGWAIKLNLTLKFIIPTLPILPML